MNDGDSNRPRVVIVDTGIANLASMTTGLRRVGLEPIASSDPSDLVDAAGLVLPGVGRFDAGVASLREAGFDSAIREFVDAARPVLAVCLGMQLLGRDSLEAPGVPGLGIIEGSVRRLPPGRVRPHLGWNMVEPEGDAEGRIVSGRGAAYFANGFAFHDEIPGWSIAWSDDGGRFVAALERGSVLACQFHPEIPGRFGTRLLSAWARLVGREVDPCCSPA